MIILYYWQYVSKHYLLTHLLLGVFVTSLGLSGLEQSLAIYTTPSGYLTTRMVEAARIIPYLNSSYSALRAAVLLTLKVKMWLNKAHIVNLLLTIPLLFGVFNELYAIRAGPHSNP